MLSDDLDTIIRRLALARELDEPLAPETWGLIEQALRCCAEDARAIESHPLRVATREVALEAPVRSNVVAFPRKLRCVTPPPPEDAS